VEFPEFAAARLPSLLRYAHLLTGDAHLAEDLVQEALTRAYLNWPKVVGADRPERYVIRILTNHYLGWRRRSWWRRDLPAGDELAPPSVPDSAGDLVERDAVWTLLGTLPRRQRAVLVLRYYEGLTDAEISELLGCAPVTVRTHAYRAFATLRERLAPANSGGTV
jgi:RNA polymerase sigma-70 factor (sigma-E family)